MPLDRSVEDASDESINRLLAEVVRFGLELLHGLAHLDHSDAGAVFFFEAEEFEDSAVVGFVAVDVDEEGFATVFFGHFGEGGVVGFVVGAGSGGEDERVLFDVAAEDLGEEENVLSDLLG